MQGHFYFLSCPNLPAERQSNLGSEKHGLSDFISYFDVQVDPVPIRQFHRYMLRRMMVVSSVNRLMHSMHVVGLRSLLSHIL